MNVATAFFYLFAFVCVASALMVVLARNPVHSVLYLILAFVNAAGLFMLAGAEFLALMLILGKALGRSPDGLPQYYRIKN